MTDTASNRAFARLSPTAARAVWALIIVTTVVLVAITFSSLRSGYADAPDRGPGDVALYRAEVDRIHAGESVLLGRQRRIATRGYPTRSVFNWRTPLPMWLLGVLPDAKIGQTVLALLAAGMWLLAFGLLESQLGRTASVAGLLAISGAVLPCVLGDLFVMPEMWAGVLIGLSAVAYGGERRKLGFAAGTGSLFLRELSGFVVPDLRADGSARAPLAQRRLCGPSASRPMPDSMPCTWRECCRWFRKTTWPTSTAGSVWRAAGFVISIAQVNAWLLLLPQWVTAAVSGDGAASARPVGRARPVSGSAWPWRATSWRSRSSASRSTSTGVHSPRRCLPSRPVLFRRLPATCGARLLAARGRALALLRSVEASLTTLRRSCRPAPPCRQRLGLGQNLGFGQLVVTVGRAYRWSVRRQFGRNRDDRLRDNCVALPGCRLRSCCTCSCRGPRAGW